MRKYIFYLTLISLLKLQVHAQWNDLNYNASWNTSSWSANMYCISSTNNHYYFNGDSLISGFPFYKLYSNIHNYRSYQGGSCFPYDNYQYNVFTGKYVLYYNHKLYVYHNTGMGGPYLKVFINYNLQIGDTIKNVSYVSWAGNGATCLIIDSIDNVLINGEYLKRFYYADRNQFMQPGYIIEKIGSSNGFVDIYSYFEFSNELRCYSENNIPLYANPFNSPDCNVVTNINQIQNNLNDVKIFPNPAMNYFEISSITPITSVIIKNYLGQIVLCDKSINENKFDISHFKQGLYFIEIETGNQKNIIKKIVKN